MYILLYLIINILIIGLFLYSKLTPYRGRLQGNYLKTFDFFDRIFSPIIGLLQRIAKPVQVGNGLAVDMSQILLLILFLILIKLLL